MLSRCFPSSFGLIWRNVQKGVLFKKIQDGCHCRHIGHQYETFLAILNQCLQPSFVSRLNMILEELPFEVFQDGSTEPAHNVGSPSAVSKTPFKK